MQIFGDLPIHWIGPVEDISGIANVNRNVIVAARKMGVPIKCTDPFREGWSHIKAHMTKEQWEYLEEAKNFNGLQPGNYVTVLSFPPHYLSEQLLDRQAKVNISYSLFETDRIPCYGGQAWQKKLNHPGIFEVWVPCKFQKDSYKKGGVEPRKIKQVQMGVDTELFTPDGDRFNIDQNKFKFFSVMDVGYRKGLDIMLKAYFEEFKDQEDTLLILKAYTGGADEASKNTIREQITKAKQTANSKAALMFIGGFLKEKQLPILHRSVDCYISTARGEGWALPVLQSMACGVPAIVGKHSSHLDYCNEGNSYLVESPQVQITDREFLGSDGRFLDHEWWEPKLDEVKKQMRHVYNHRDEVRQKGLLARQEAEKFDWSITVRKALTQSAKWAPTADLTV